MWSLLLKLLRLLRRCFFFLLYLLLKTIAGFLQLIIFFSYIWTSFLRPLMKDFLIIIRDHLVVYVVLPLASFVGQIIGFFFALFLIFSMKFLEAVCFIFFFLWEICEWKVYRRNFLLIIYYIMVIIVWACYLNFLFTIYDSGCLCCLERGAARCTPIFFLLLYTTYFFLEARRALRRFFVNYIPKK